MLSNQLYRPPDSSSSFLIDWSRIKLKTELITCNIKLCLVIWLVMVWPGISQFTKKTYHNLQTKHTKTSNYFTIISVLIIIHCPIGIYLSPFLCRLSVKRGLLALTLPVKKNKCHLI